MPIRVHVPGKGIVEFPDGTPPEVMEQALAEFKTPERTWGDTFTDALPTVGATLGGIAGAAGGPLVAAGVAGLGGAAGQGARRIVQGLRGRDIPQGTAALTDMAGTGAAEGALQLVGGAVGGGMARGARRMYQGLAKPSTRIRKEFPDAMQTLLDERAPISRGGLQKVEGLTARSAQQADDLIAHAAPVSRTIRPREIISEFGDTVKQLRKRVDIGQESELPKVGERGKRLMATDRGTGIELERAQQLKRAAQDAANAGYRQAERGTVKEVGADTLLDKDVARGFRKAIEQRVPAVGPVNRRTQSLVGARSVLDDALSREGNTLASGGMRDAIAIGGGAALGSMAGTPEGGAGAGLLLRLLSAPNTGSRAAILMNDAARLGIPAHLLRLLMMGKRTQEQE